MVDDPGYERDDDARRNGPEQLPYGFNTQTDDGEILATARPDLNYLLLRVSPQREERLFTFYVMGFREEKMHGERGRFGLTRNVRLLRRRCYALFYDLLAGETTIEEAKPIIVSHWRAAETLHDLRTDMLETVDRFLTHSVIRDEGFLREQAARLTDDPVKQADLMRTPQKQSRGQQEDIPLDGIYDSLLDIEEQYGKHTAVAVADAALDIPMLVEPLAPGNILGIDADDIDAGTVEPEDIDLEARFERSREILCGVDMSIDGMGTIGILDRIKEDLDDGIGSRDGGLRDIPLPLIDRPTEVMGQSQISTSGDEFESGSSILSSILTDAFRAVGAVGTVIFRTGDGEDGWEWLLNPVVADQPVAEHIPFPDDEGDITYGGYWQLNFLADVVLAALLDESGLDGGSESFACPLCECSQGRYCGDSSCGCRSYLDAATKMESRFRAADPTWTTDL